MSNELWTTQAVAYAGRRVMPQSESLVGHLLLILRHNQEGPTRVGSQEVLIEDQDVPELQVGAIYHLQVVEAPGAIPSIALPDHPQPVAFIEDQVSIIEWLVMDAAVEARQASRVMENIGRSKTSQEAIDLLLDPIRLFLGNANIDEQTRQALRMLLLTKLMS